MSTLGNTTTPNQGFDEPGAGYAFASKFTTPSGPGIIITDIHANFGLSSGSNTGKAAVWDSSGNLLGSVSVGSLSVVNPGSYPYNSCPWKSGSVTGFYVAGNTTIYIGGWTAGNLLYESESGGTSYVKSMGSLGNLGGSPPTGPIGAVGAYVDYENAGCYLNTGTAASPSWSGAPVYVNTGTPASPNWTSAEVLINTGTPASPVWTPSS